MSDVIIARRYAQAFKEEADSLGITEKVDADVALVRASLVESRELRQVFESPVVSREKKSAIVKALFQERVDPTTLRFLLLMIAKRREDIFSQVGQAYAELRDEQLGIVDVSVRIARPMDETEEKELQRSIENMIGKRARLNIQMDSSLLGGLVVRVGDTLYDGSVSNQLKSLREKLTTGQHATNNH